MRIATHILVIAGLATSPAQAAGEAYFRMYAQPPSGASQPPLVSTDSTTGMTVSIPCSLCRVRTNGQFDLRPTVSGAQGQPTWTLSSGMLPPGASLSASDGSVTGIPASAGSWTFALAVSDERNQPVVSRSVTVQVLNPPYVSYASSTGLSNRTISLRPTYGSTFGQVAYALAAGSLPAGLTLDPARGIISGTVGSTALRLQVQITDADGAAAVSAPFDIINSDQGVIAFDSPSYAARTGVPMSVKPTIIGLKRNARIAVTSGSVPVGMSVEPSTGEIQGTPAVSGISPNIVLAAPDANDAMVASDPITIMTVQPSVSYAPYRARFGRPYSLTPSVAGLDAPSFTQVAGGLPQGLSLSPSDGSITGTPAASGTFGGIQVTAVDGQMAQATSPAFGIEVLAVPAATVRASTAGRVGLPLSLQPQWEGFEAAPAWALSAGTLPPGLSLDQDSGLIQGSPASAGDTQGLVLTATQGADSAATSGFGFSIAPPLSLAYPASTVLPRTRVARIPASKAGTIGTPAFALSGGSLPAGLSVEQATGDIVGIPTASGSVSGLSATLTDSGQSTTSNAFGITVADQTATMASATTRLGRAFSQAATSTLVTDPAWTLAGTLPAGLSARTNGTVEGAPQAAGNFTGLTMTATGTNGSATTAPFGINVLDTYRISLAPADVTQSARVGTAATAHAPTVSNPSGTPVITLGTVTGTAPANVAADASGIVTYTPTAAGSWTYALGATDPDGATATSNTATVNVLAALQASAGDIPVRAGGTASTPLNATPASAPTWTLAPGAPGWLAVSGSTATASPPSGQAATAYGPYTARVIDADGATAMAPFKVLVNPALTIANAADLFGSAGQALTRNPPAVGGAVGTLTYALLKGGSDVSSALGSTCPGLAFSTVTGVISGTPSAACSASLDYRVSDDGRGTPSLVATATATAPFALTVNAATVTASTQSVSVAEGDTVSFSATTSIPSPTWSASGNPAWMTFTNAGGTYSTSSVSADVTSTQIYNVTLTASGGGASAPQTVSVTVNPAAVTLSTPSAVRSGGSFTAAVAETMAAAGSWAASADPADVGGLVVSGSTLSGTAPANAGPTAVTRTLTATHTASSAPSSGARATAAASAILTVQPSLGVAAPASQAGSAGNAMSFAAPAVNGRVGTLAYALYQGAADVSGSLGSVCPGLSFSTATGAVSGPPTAACSATLAYRVSDDGNGNASLAATATSAPFTVNVSAATVTASSQSVTVTEGDTVAFSATTSIPSPSWSVSGQPAWMAFSQSGGTYSTSSVSPDVTTAQTYSVVLTASGGGASAPQTVSVTVNPAAVTLATPAPVRSGAPFTAAVSESMAAAGSWSASANPADVAGLAVSGTTLSGTAPANGTAAAFARTLTATHTANAVPSSGVRATAFASSTLTVHPALTVAGPANQSGTAGTALSFAAPSVGGQVGTLSYALYQGGADVSDTLSSICGGLGFTRSTGAVSGTPSGACSATLAYRVSDNGGANGATLAATATSSAFTLSVGSATATASTGSVSVMEGEAVAISATTNLPSPSWSVSGQPAWMTFTQTGGTYSTSSVSANVDSVQTYAVTLTASNGSGASAPTTVNVTVSPAAVSIQSPSARSGKAFTSQVSGSLRVGSYWTVVAVPADVGNLQVSGTTLSGTAPNYTGSGSVTRTLYATTTANAGPSNGAAATATNGGTLTVYPGVGIGAPAGQGGSVGLQMAFAPPALTNQVGGVSYALTQNGTNVSGSLNSICPGLSFSTADGSVSGIPTAQCSANLAYVVTDGGGDPNLTSTAASQAFNLTVGGNYVTANKNYATYIEGDPMDFFAYSATQWSTWKESGNPGWMGFRGSFGRDDPNNAFSPDVTSPQTYNVTITGTDFRAGTTGSVTVVVTVNPAVTTLTDAAVRSGGAFSMAAASTMRANAAWSASSSAGDVGNLAYSGSTLTGTAPGNGGTSAITRTVTATRTATTAPTNGSPNATASGNATLTVFPNLSIGNQGYQQGRVGTNLQVNPPGVVGRAGTLTYALLRNGSDVSGSLGSVCPGLSFSTASGVIGGTPSSPCSVALDYRVSDNGNGNGALAASATDTSAFTLSVSP